MILQAHQRAGGKQLAQHLLNTRDNDHVEVHELRGFVSDDLIGAFTESYAVSRGTKCRQFLFSLSLNPPPAENVSIEVFEKTIEDIEKRMGLSGQPRAIVFHDKAGRSRHAHCVWSRINVHKMRAINLPHYKLKLQDMSRQLYLEHGWKMPRGFMKEQEADPLNYSLAEWQQARRQKADPKEIKRVLQECWAISDNSESFARALKENGFALARGNRRGHVAVDGHGEVYAVSRWVGKKAKDVRARLGSPEDLPSVATAKQELQKELDTWFKALKEKEAAHREAEQKALQARRTRLVARQRKERAGLKDQHAERRARENRVRAARLPTGLKALWFRLSGAYTKIKHRNEAEAHACDLRDRKEMQRLMDRQLHERRHMQREVQEMGYAHKHCYVEEYMQPFERRDR